MPIYEHSYRTFDGEVVRRFRWWSIVKQEFRVLFSARPFLILLIIALILFLFRILQIVTYDTLYSDPNNMLAQFAREIELLDVGPRLWYDFLSFQASLVFIMCLYAGSGMICDDVRNNLLEVYFSKPLFWRDYVLGKIMTLVLLGFGLTFFPAVILVIQHNLLAPSMDTLRESWWFIPASLAYSLAICVPTALGVLASSALFMSQRFAGIAIFMILFANMTIGGLLEGLLHRDGVLIIAFPIAVNRIGEAVFDLDQSIVDTPWPVAAIYVGTVSLICLVLICRRIRKAEGL